MAIKKYTSGAWVSTSYHKYGTETETITSLPAQIIGDGQQIMSCQVSGNTVQNGTPTPEAPVDVVGCGTWDETQQSYKLPLTVNGTVYPIYLGQVPTTRRIKKLVLTGEEDMYATSDGALYFTPQDTMIKQYRLYCTHYAYYDLPRYELPVNAVTTRGGAGTSMWFKTEYATLADFKSYLAAQYAAGTPVTVWYVLAKPETAVVNEPLYKIGNYADTISATNIPTTGTPENFDVGTTLKPSEVQLTYHGWHEHTDTKYTQGE